jgi:hypothetical protein
MTRFTSLALAAVFCFALVGCDEKINNTVVVTPVQQQPTAADGSFKTTASRLVSSKEFYLDKKEVDVLKQLNDVINSGSYNIVQVTTTYSNAYLTSAQVDYVPDEKGIGNTVRVKFLTPTKFYWSERDLEVKKMKEAQNPPSFKVQTLVLQGYSVNGELWYYQPASGK